tara:strand:- start:5676 stop:6398 length:723 start_codon:yes stop_codon:yes gene_type:complete
MINVDKVYVLHYTKLEERKKNLEGALEHFGIDYEFVTDFDQEDLTDQIIEEWYSTNEDDYNRKIDPLWGAKQNPFRKLNLAEISCTIKHYLCIKKVAENCNERGLILEDDVFFVENFPEVFNHFLSKTPNDWGAIFMGCCANLRVPQRLRMQGVCAYPKEHPASRGGDSYILKKNVAQKIVSTMKPFNTISDWELACQLHQHNVKTYWWEPPLVVQGSENGAYKTTLNDDNHRELYGGVY